jgi:hemolysin activation/secretion protein
MRDSAQSFSRSSCVAWWRNWWWLLFVWCAGFALQRAGAQDAGASHFEVQSYSVQGFKLFSTNSLARMFARYTGTNVSVEDLVQAAADLQAEYAKHGYRATTIAIPLMQITNGVARLNVAQSPFSQILVSGRNYFGFSSGATVALLPIAADATNVVAVATNAEPGFPVKAYEITGNTLLSTETLISVLAKYTGTNITKTDIFKAREDLQLEYRDRGFPTVSVLVPPQEITNQLVKMRIFQGRLSDITIVHNHYFSSNNIMRALPSLRTNIILNGPVFQAELDQANANQDRQIYPEVSPGPVPNTSELTLKVQDRLPLHAKVELNNQNSPGTPDLRVNTSAVYNNLWQHEHSLGLQYSFSPEAYKTGDQWNLYDQPLVANYSGFYRFHIGEPDAVSATVASQPGTFGYDEATRKFRLPPPSGAAELNLYASRSTIDTGLEKIGQTNFLNIPGVISVTKKDIQQDITINEDLGSRLSVPLNSTANFRSTLSGGADYKNYELTSQKTNNFLFSIITRDTSGNPLPPVTTTISSPNPPPNGTTVRKLEYLPLSLRYDASLRDPLGMTAFSLGLSVNAWFSGPGLPASGTGTNRIPALNAVQLIAGSREASGHWVILTPSLTRDFTFRTNWTLSLHAEGQWADQPLISNEQFGIGGVGNVRGYQEGEVFGDNGWRLNVELKTPGRVLGIVHGKQALILRGSIYADYGEVFLIDPQGRDSSTSLAGVGFGGVLSIGTHWDARLLFSWPLLNGVSTEAFQPRFNFGLTAQF